MILNSGQWKVEKIVSQMNIAQDAIGIAIMNRQNNSFSALELSNKVLGEVSNAQLRYSQPTQGSPEGKSLLPSIKFIQIILLLFVVLQPFYGIAGCKYQFTSANY
jgi:hypothetical protein